MFKRFIGNVREVLGIEPIATPKQLAESLKLICSTASNRIDMLTESEKKELVKSDSKTKNILEPLFDLRKTIEANIDQYAKNPKSRQIERAKQPILDYLQKVENVTKGEFINLVNKLIAELESLPE